MQKELLSTSQVAEILGVSRITVFNKIKEGKIKAEKIGRNFVIEKKELLEALGTVISAEKKKEIDQVVKKATNEYGEALKKLGQE